MRVAVLFNVLTFCIWVRGHEEAVKLWSELGLLRVDISPRTMLVNGLSNFAFVFNIAIPEVAEQTNESCRNRQAASNTTAFDQAIKEANIKFQAQIHQELHILESRHTGGSNQGSCRV